MSAITLGEAASELLLTPEFLLWCTSYAPRRDGRKLRRNEDGKFSRDELKAFDAHLRQDWGNRYVPVGVRDELRREALGSCGICDEPTETPKLAHIRRRGLEVAYYFQHPHNLLSMCGTCHDRYDDQSLSAITYNVVAHRKRLRLQALVRGAAESQKFVFLPKMPSYHFVGREEMLDSLTEAAKQRRTAVTCLTGLGGIGKTQIALEYCHRQLANHTVVWWLNATTVEAATSGLSALATALGLDGSLGLSEQVRQLNRRLENPGVSWLIVVDDASDPQSVVPLLPRQGQGHVVVTSRNPNWRQVGDVLEVGTLNAEHSVALLTAVAGSNDIATAHHLAGRLGFLPLAIVQAGAYVGATGCTLAEYEQLYSDHAAQLLAAGPPPLDYPYTVATTWDIAFVEVSRLCPTALSFLAVLSFLSPGGVPVGWLAQLTEMLSAVSAELERTASLSFDARLAVLRRFSLIERHEGRIWLHALVQVVTRARQSDSERAENLSMALGVLQCLLPPSFDDHTHAGRRADLVPHILAAVAISEELALCAEHTVMLRVLVGAHQIAMGEYATACGTLVAAVHVAKANNADPGPALQNLATAQYLNDDLEGAESTVESALRIVQEYSDAEISEPLKVALRSIKSTLLWRRGKSRESYQEAVEALRAGTVAYAGRPRRLAVLMNNLAGAMRAQGRLREAQQFYEMAITELGERIESLPEGATVLAGLGGVLRELGHAGEALAQFERATQVAQDLLGADHPEVSRHLNNVALQLENDEPSRAEASYERALNIANSAYPMCHRGRSCVLRNFGVFLAGRGRFERGVRMCLEALHVDEFVNEPPHDSIAMSTHALARAYECAGENAAARKCYMGALGLWEQLIGLDHPIVGEISAAILRLGGGLQTAQADRRRAKRRAKAKAARRARRKNRRKR